MSVFCLNNISVTVALDSTCPVSLVIPQVLSLLENLTVVTVSCQPIEGVSPLCCILDLGNANDLHVDCVLSHDYFACLSAVFHE